MQPKKTLLLLLVFGLCACGPDLETVEETDPAGFRAEYTVDPETRLRQGTYRLYNDRGELTEEANYQDGELEGLRILYNENGDTNAVETHRAGQFAGPYRSYYAGNQIKQRGQYTDDAMSGRWMSYYPNGRVKEIVTFADNRENGPFREWYENGTLAAEGSYQDGDNEQGRLRIYNEDGTLNRVMECEGGICRSVWRDTLGVPPPPRQLPEFD